MQIEMPDLGEAATAISTEKLLGPDGVGKIDAVFEGGGVKALAQIGAVKALEDLNLSYGLLAGTSGGAIMAALLASVAGSDEKGSDKMWEFLSEVGLYSLVDVPYLPRVAFLQKRLYLYAPVLAHLMWTKGMVSGNVFLREIRRILRKQDGTELRFRDLLRSGAEQEGDPTRRYSLKVVATDISRGRPIVIPDDLPAYWNAWKVAADSSGKSVDELTADDARDWWPVAEAVRMSMSIPFFFKPFTLRLNTRKEGRKKIVREESMGQPGRQVLIVDGGVSSNYPIWLFDRAGGKPRWPTFGFLLDEKRDAPVQRARTSRFLTDLAMSVVGTGIGAMDKRLSKHDEYRTAFLRTLQVSTTEFGLDPAAQQALVRSGFEDAVEFLDRFNWAEYVREYRQ
jgi:NTE family protein